MDQHGAANTEIVRVDQGALRAMVAGMFVKVGVPLEDATLAADVLITADMRGVDSHGVSNLLRRYLDDYSDGLINPQPDWTIIRESPATATVDCDNGLGSIIAPKAMRVAIEKARATGIGVVTMRKGRHLGMASYHAMLALESDMIGVCMTAVNPWVPPVFGREPRLGTNPIAVAVPSDGSHPFVLDISTSVVPVNRLRQEQRFNSLVPGGWIADGEGTPIMEPGMLPEQYSILPLGSIAQQGSHKGYGLSCVVEILCGVLSGGGYAMMLERGQAQHMVTAYNIESFVPVDEFKKMMNEWMDMLNATPPALGHDRVLVPGQLEFESEQENTEKGLPLPAEVVSWLRDLSLQMNVPYLL